MVKSEIGLNTVNSCCFSSLVSAFKIINQIKAANAILKSIEEWVGFRNRIDFATVFNDVRYIRLTAQLNKE